MGVSTASRGDTVVIMLNSASAANTAAATSSYVSIKPYKGEVAVTQMVGTVTGSITGKLQSATDSGGTGVADITGATFTAVSSANNAQVIYIPKSAGPWIRYVGTIVTGPAIVGVVLTAKPGSV